MFNGLVVHCDALIEIVNDRHDSMQSMMFPVGNFVDSSLNREDPWIMRES